MRYFFQIGLLFFLSSLDAQVSDMSSPTSFSHELDTIIPSIKTDDLDISKLEKDDLIDYNKGLAPRFGYSFIYDIDFFEYAACDILDNGDKIFRLEIESKNAYSINLIFNNFFLSEKTKLFIYNEEKSHVIGAFTSTNNKSFNRFSTAPISGEKIILEYYEPLGADPNSKINISNIIHGYKNTFSKNNRGYGDSEECNNNVSCPDAQPWNDAINSVVLTLTDGGTRLCSGSMINNVNEDFELYFLTSETCLGGHEDWIFMFNYESPECNNEDGPTDQTISGATLLAHNHESDFALLKLAETPPEYFDIYFAGWDIRGMVPQDCISIHHPVGDIKKISYDQGSAVSDGWYSNDGTHWRIDEWDSGITEPGSYGAPLFNSNNHIVGQLHGGESSCDEPVDDYYGKLSHSWDLGLSQWLDPDNTGTLTLDGIEVINSPDPELFYSNSEFNVFIADNQIQTLNLLLSNFGEDESILNYEIYNSPFSKVYSLPDQENYYWIDSDASNTNDQYDYYWLDINSVGSPVWFEDNDQAAGPFDIGFDFSFYNNIYSEFIISPNGWIGFGNDNPEWDNTAIPSPDAPSPAIFAFWDDLNPLNADSSPDMAGEVKYYTDGQKLVVSYEDVVHWGDDSPYRFQIIINKEGKININYAGMNGERESATIGIQNENGQVGQQVVYNDSYIHNFLGLTFEQAPYWLTIDNQNYIINQLSSQESINHSIGVDANEMLDGNYLTYIHIESNATGPITIPVSVQVGYQFDIGDVNYDGEINVQDVVVLINIILNNSPPNLEADINQDGQINVLDTVLLIDLILN